MPYYHLFYHFVWGTKNRERIILPEFEAELHKVIAAKAIEMGAMIHALGGVDDHAHLAVTVPPKLSLSRFIGEVKGSSAHAVNHEINPRHNFRWQTEYGVFSFGEKSLPGIVKYIRAQKEHHAQGTMIAAMENVEEQP